MRVITLDQLPLCQLGEAPWWDVQAQRLIFVDIDSSKIYRFDPMTKEFDVINTGSLVGFAILDEDGKVVVGLRDGIYRFEFGRTTRELLARPARMPPDARFNNGICDRWGRLWAGTMSLNPERPNTSSLYCLDQGEIREVETRIRVSNGTGWSPDNKVMYYVDTRTAEIRCYDYDITTGTISGRRTFATVPHEDGRPDGLTVDSEGQVLVALYAGSRINIYTSEGVLADVIRFPVPNITSLTFGGNDLKTLYVTSASSGLTTVQQGGAQSGNLFAVEMNTHGIPDVRFKKIPAPEFTL